MEVLKLEHLKVLDLFYSSLRSIRLGRNAFEHHFNAILGFAKVEFLYDLTKDQAFATALEYFHSLKIEVPTTAYPTTLDRKEFHNKFKELEDRNISQFLKVLDKHLDELAYEYARRKLLGLPYQTLIDLWRREIKNLGTRSGQYSVIIKVGCDSGRRFIPMGKLLYVN